MAKPAAHCRASCARCGCRSAWQLNDPRSSTARADSAPSQPRPVSPAATPLLMFGRRCACRGLPPRRPQPDRPQARPPSCLLPCSKHLCAASHRQPSCAVASAESATLSRALARQDATARLLLLDKYADSSPDHPPRYCLNPLVDGESVFASKACSCKSRAASLGGNHDTMPPVMGCQSAMSPHSNLCSGPGQRQAA